MAIFIRLQITNRTNVTNYELAERASCYLSGLRGFVILIKSAMISVESRFLCTKVFLPEFQ